MTTPGEIKQLAYQRLAEANVLAQHQHFDGAFYLAGYSVELMLKAKICERFAIPNLFDENKSGAESIRGVAEVRRAVKTHDLFTLLIFSGLKVKLELAIAQHKVIANAFALIFNGWNEHVRYKPSGAIRKADVLDTLASLNDESNLLLWIEMN